MNSMRNTIAVAVRCGSLLLSECTMTSRYGKPMTPVPGKADTYVEHGYMSYEITSSTCASASCTYTVRYSR